MLSNKIAHCALSFFNESLKNKGKPQEKEWTVYAAIVAVEEKSNAIWVVSCSTGSKCCACNEANVGHALHDSHAEVLSRRGLLLELWNEINGNSKKDASKNLLVKSESSSSTFELRTDLTLHLYISDSPCGDASIYTINESSDTCNLRFTGAKLVLHDEASSIFEASKNGSLLSTNNNNKVGREHEQKLSALRTKSGRSNLPSHKRSTSMSCSDKICRWAIFGVQGALLQKFIPKPIGFTSIVVSRDQRCDILQQLAALERAIPSRTKSAVKVLQKHFSNVDEILNYCSLINPKVEIVDESFSHGKAHIDYLQRNSVLKEETFTNPRKKKKKSFSPCGMSINWQQSTQVAEVTVGATGMKQQKRSRLCRLELSLCARKHEIVGKTYQDLKSNALSKERITIRDTVFNNPDSPLYGWLCNSNLNNFKLD